MNFKQLRGLLLTALLSAILIVSLIPKPAVAQVTMPPREETYIYDYWEYFAGVDNWNPFTFGSTYQRLAGMLSFESLFYANYETGEIIPWLAESYEYNNDFSEFTIHLRKGIKWSDGVPFTADDIVYTYKMVRDHPELMYHSEVTLALESEEKVDDYTVKLKLKTPDPRFHFGGGWTPPISTCFLLKAMPIIPKHIFEKVEDPVTYKFYPPVMTGPYLLKSASNSLILMERNDDWWATEVYHVRPAPKYVAHVRYGTAEVEALKQISGELDVVAITSFYSEVMEEVMAKNPKVRGWSLTKPYGYYDVCPRYLSFSWDIYPYNIPEVRWAISYMINRSRISELVPDYGVMTYFWAPFGAFDPYNEAIQDLIDQYGPSEYNPERAYNLLKGLGFEVEDGVWTTPNGTKLAFDLIKPGTPETAWELVAEDLAKGNVSANLVYMDYGVYSQRYNVGDYTAMYAGACGAFDPLFVIRGWHSKFYIPRGQPGAIWSQNIERWRGDPEFDRIIDEWSTTPPTDLEKCKQYCHDAIEILLRNCVLGPLLYVELWPFPHDTTYWVGWPVAEDNWIVPYTWSGSMLQMIVGYMDPETGEWLPNRGLKPAKIDYTTVYFEADTPKFRGIDVVWYGPFRVGDAARVPSDDAEFWIRKGYASLTPPTATFSTIWLLKDVAAFVGTDGKTYGPYSAGSSASVPTSDASRLVAAGSATYTPPQPVGLLDTVDATYDAVTSLLTSMSDLRTDIANLRTSLATLSTDISNLRTTTSGITTSINTLSTTVTDLKAAVDQLSGQLNMFSMVAVVEGVGLIIAVTAIVVIARRKLPPEE